MSEPDSSRAFDARAIEGMPTPILQAIYLGVQKELTRRRAMDAVSRKTMLASTSYQRLTTEKFKYSKYRLLELGELMAQDWSHLFAEGDTEPKYYVYAHVLPKVKAKDFRVDGEFKMDLPGTPFYIGKGCGERAWDLKRNEGHGVELRTLTSHGHTADQIVHIVRDKLTERAALEIESKLIYFFGTKFERDRRGLLVNLDIPKRPSRLSFSPASAMRPDAMRSMQQWSTASCAQERPRRMRLLCARGFGGLTVNIRPASSPRLSARASYFA